MSQVARMMMAFRDYNSYDGVDSAVANLGFDMKIVYVTGCLGFIGSHFTRAALKKGWKVMGVDAMSYASNPNLLSEFQKFDNFKFLRTDIEDITYMCDCDYVVNFAAESHVDNSIANSDSFLSSNILGVKNLLELIKRKRSGSRPIFLQISTDEVYGDSAESGAHAETDMLKPSNPYSASKASADMLVTAWARTYGLDYLIVRPTNNYGIGQYPEKLIPASVKNLQRGKKISLHNKGTPIRNWLHVEDTVAAIMLLIKQDKKNEIYNVAGGFEQSNLNTVVRILYAYFNLSVDFDIYVDLTTVREGQDMKYALNDRKLKNLGWEPKFVFDVEIQNIVDWHKTHFIW